MHAPTSEARPVEIRSARTVPLSKNGDADKTHLGEEMADVLLYLVRLADRCGVDLPAVAKAKLAKNEAKYPAEKCFGSAAKYTAYV